MKNLQHPRSTPQAASALPEWCVHNTLSDMASPLSISQQWLSAATVPSSHIPHHIFSPPPTSQPVFDPFNPAPISQHRPVSPVDRCVSARSSASSPMERERNSISTGKPPSLVSWSRGGHSPPQGLQHRTDFGDRPEPWEKRVEHRINTD